MRRQARGWHEALTASTQAVGLNLETVSSPSPPALIASARSKGGDAILASGWGRKASCRPSLKTADCAAAKRTPNRERVPPRSAALQNGLKAELQS